MSCLTMGCKVSRVGLVLMTGLAWLGNAVTSQVWAAQNPPGCSANNLIVNIQKGANAVTNGAVVNFTVTIVNVNAPETCDIKLGAAGLVFSCPGTDGTPSGPQTVLIPGNTLLPPGFAPAPFVIPCTINVAPGVTTVQARIAAPGALLLDNPFQDDPANIDKTVSLNVFMPCIRVTKECDYPAECDPPAFPYGAPVRVKGTVTNCGNTPLANVTVVDDHAGLLLGPIVLQPGASSNYSGMYQPAGNLCGPLNDTVTASGTVIQLDNPIVITHTAMASCRVCENPCITVTKTCPPTVPRYTTSIPFSGVVRNCGNVPLTNVRVVDDNATPGNTADDIVINLANLPVGGSVNYSGSHTVSREYCGPLTDTVVAYARSVCGTDVASNPANCTTEIFCPDVCITKEVACLLPGGVCGQYDKTATGVKDSSCPTFCYRITVVNCGGEDLRNVQVSDNRLSLAGCNFPATLAIGQSYTCTVKTELCDSIVNTATVTGIGVRSGLSVSDTDSAMVVIKPAAIDCEITLTSSFDMDEADCKDNVPPAPPNPCDNHLLLPDGFLGPIAFYLKVCNTAQATLRNIQITGLPADCVPNIPETLAAGECFTISCMPTVSCPEGAKYDVTVTADVSDENGTLCIYDKDGRRINVDTRCYALVECKPPVACRTTGGGKQYPSDAINGAADGELPATLIPDNVLYVTHGGQVGASLGRASQIILNDPCIKGQWEHVRHNKAGTTGNFHSEYFDSLECACLGCTDPVTGQNISPMITGVLCNPDNRICGPEPRRAPANAICFSGVGNWTEVPGRRAGESVVFRVYIEDRSEPGGSPPGRHHAEDPPDVYCIQIWKITGNPNSAPNEALRKAVAAASTIGAGINVPAGVRAPDVYDCGPLSRGNHQLHPSTGAVCKE